MCLSIEWRIVEDHFKSLCSVLPHNYQLTIDKLKTIPQLLKAGGEQLCKLISASSPDVRRINERIITYLIVKLCWNDSNNSLVRLCDVMDESIDSTDTTTGIQQIRYGEYIHYANEKHDKEHRVANICKFPLAYCEYFKVRSSQLLHIYLSQKSAGDQSSL